MVLNNQGLRESVVKTIQSDSVTYAKQFDGEYRNYASDDYEAGSTAQALKSLEREKKLVEALERIGVTLENAKKMIDIAKVDIDNRIETALKQYNESI